MAHVPYEQTPEGIELQFGANHIGHFLFTNLIMEKLIGTRRNETGRIARVVNVASDGYRLGPVRFDDWNFDVALPILLLLWWEKWMLTSNRMATLTIRGTHMDSPRLQIYYSPDPWPPNSQREAWSLSVCTRVWFWIQIWAVIWTPRDIRVYVRYRRSRMIARLSCE